MARCTQILSPNTEDAKYVINFCYPGKVHFNLAFTSCGTFFWRCLKYEIFLHPPKLIPPFFKFCPSIFIFFKLFLSSHCPYQCLSFLLLKYEQVGNIFVFKFKCSTMFSNDICILNSFSVLYFMPCKQTAGFYMDMAF